MSNPIPKSAYAYTQPFFAELYDPWVAELFQTAPDDAPLFQRLVRSALDASNGATVTVVDLATGTGRVIHALGDAFPDELRTRRLRLVGTDNSVPMLSRAARKASEAVAAADVAWVEAPLSSFPRPLAGASPPVLNADVVLCAAGSIAHLASAAEVDAFLHGLKQVLTPTTGRAVVSVLRDFLRGKDGGATTISGGPKQPAAPVADVDFGRALCLPSVDHPGAVYERGATNTRWSDDGRVCTEVFRASLVEEGARVIWEEVIGWELRVMDEEEWERQIEAAGLDIVEKVEMEIQRVYVLMKA